MGHGASVPAPAGTPGTGVGITGAEDPRVVALRAEIDRLTRALRWLARNDANGWVREKVRDTLRASRT